MRTSVKVISAGAAIVLASTIAGAVVLASRPARRPGPVDSAASATATAPIDRAGNDNPDRDGDVRRLRRSVGDLQAAVGDLQRRGERADEEARPRTPEALAHARQAARAKSDARFARIGASHEAARPDAAWSAAVGEQFRQRLSEPLYQGAALQAVDCRETTCRADILVQSGQEQLVGPVLAQVPGFSAGTLQLQPAENGQVRLVSYLAREGASFPADPDSPAPAGLPPTHE